MLFKCLPSEFYLLCIVCGEFVKFEKSREKSKREIMQKIILFVEPNDDAFQTPAKIGDIFMNRFAVDENASCEILKRFELGKSSLEMSWPEGESNKNFVTERQRKGMDHFIISVKTKVIRYKNSII